MPYCPACGTAVERNDRFCYNCGTGLDAGRQSGGEAAGPVQRPAAHQKGWDHPAHARTRGWTGQPPRTQQPRDGQPGGHRTAETVGQGRHTGGSYSSPWGGQQPTGQQAQWRGQQQHVGGQYATGQWRGSRPTEREGMLGFALSFPSRSGWEPVVLGGFGLLFGILLVPLVFVIGYLLRLAGRAAAGEYYPPTFDDEEGLFRDGFVYSLALSVFLVAWVGGAALAVEVTWWLGLAVGILGSYLPPAYFVTAAVQGPVAALGARETLVDLLTAREYVVGYLLSVVVVGGIGSMVVGMMLFMSLFLSILGLFIWPVVVFYWLGIQAALWGRVYHDVDPARRDVDVPSGGDDGASDRASAPQPGGTATATDRPRHEGWTDPE